MTLLISTPIRFQSTPDGRIWARQESDGYHFWTRYLAEFSSVTLLARVRKVSAPTAKWLQVDGPGVRCAPIPDFVGPYQLMRKWFPVRRAVHAAVHDAESILLRVPCNVGTLAWKTISAGHPYAVEVLGDPYASLSPAAMDTGLRPLWRWLLPYCLRRICRDASGTAYVTEFALQRFYPPSKDSFSTSYSDVMTTHYSSTKLRHSVIRDTPRVHRADQKTYTVISVGAMEMLPKAQDVLIEACASCVRGGLDLRLVLVGDGKLRKRLEALAARTEMTGRVVFTGQLTGEDQVTQALDRADLFALPSRTEGLPRAMLEAMARGMPCVGSDVGGIPELISPDSLVSPDNVPALAEKLREVLGDPARMDRMSQENLLRVADYSDEVLRRRREEFYRHLASETVKFNKSGGAHHG